jgi:hypothetical protein
MFGSTSIAAHLTRGVIAAALIAWAVLDQSSNPAFAVIAIALAIVAMRGCPMCWVLGLVETVGNRMRPFSG